MAGVLPSLFGGPTMGKSFLSFAVGLSGLGLPVETGSTPGILLRGWLGGWLGGWVVGWVIGWLVGWLVGWVGGREGLKCPGLSV